MIKLCVPKTDFPILFNSIPYQDTMSTDRVKLSLNSNLLNSLNNDIKESNSLHSFRAKLEKNIYINY